MLLDVNSEVSLNPNDPEAHFRKGCLLFKEEEYESALLAFKKASELNPEEKKYKMWIRKCEAEIEDEENENKDESSERQDKEETTTQTENNTTTTTANGTTEPLVQPAAPEKKKKFRHEWFQTDQWVTIDIFIKNLKPEQVKVDFGNSNLDVNIKLDDSTDFNFDIELADSIIPNECKYNILSTKLEVKLKKSRVSKWKTLEKIGENSVGQWDTRVDKTKKNSIHEYPSSKGNKDWSKIGNEEEKLEGLEELNKMFETIYANGTDDQRRAMLKSFYESGGTVLSTDWNEIGKSKVEVKPPEGLEVRSWNEDK